MATRTELLNGFQQYSTPILEKLEIIANSILTPLDGELTNVDFASIVDSVFSVGGIADQKWPEWTDKSKSDFGRLLVEIMALFSDKDMFYINHLSKENYASTAELYRSLVHKALERGIPAPGNDSATGTIQLTVSAGSAEVVPRGAIEIGSSIIPELTFTNQEFAVPTTGVSTNESVEFIHGVLLTDSDTFNGLSIILNNNGVSRGTIELVINNQEWTEVASFLDSSSSDKHFMALYDENGRVEIIFGRNNYGLRPEKGESYRVSYIQGGGTLGNIAAGALDQIQKSDTVRTVSAFNQLEMTGGNAQVDKEKLRQQIIGQSWGQNRVVVAEDATSVVNTLEFVKKSFSEAVGQFLYIYAYPDGGGALSAMQITQIEDLINGTDTLLLMGYNLTVASPIYTPITLELTVYLLPTYSKLGAQTVAEEVIQDYLDPEKNGEFGQGVTRTVLAQNILNNVAGSQNVVFNVLYKGAVVESVNDLTFINQELVDWAGSSITVNIIGGV
jgi:hypothetical protein